MIKLGVWSHPTTDQIRIYLNSGNRAGSKIFFSKKDDGTIEVHSKNLDTPASRLRGDAYGKRDKDSAAATECLEALDLTRSSPFADLLDYAEGRKTIVEVM